VEGIAELVLVLAAQSVQALLGLRLGLHLPLLHILLHVLLMYKVLVEVGLVVEFAWVERELLLLLLALLSPVGPLCRLQVFPVQGEPLLRAQS